MRLLLGVVLALAMSATSSAIELEPLYNGFCQLHTVHQQTTIDQHGRRTTKQVSAGVYSGQFVAENDNAFLILTCGHGPEPAPFNSRTWVKCFHHQNLTSTWMAGTTIWYKRVKGDYTNDLGLIVVPKSEFRRVKYPYPTLAKISTKPVKAGQWVYNLGRGGDYEYPNVIRGWVTKTGEHRFWSRPKGQGGRSGSAFYNEDGLIVGLLLASDKSNNTTIVINSPRIMELLHEYQQWRARPRSNRGDGY